MTIAQAEFDFGTREYEASTGDTLTQVARKLYGEESPKTYRILKSLNSRYDWDNIKPGSIIKYIDKSNIDVILEIW